MLHKITLRIPSENFKANLLIMVPSSFVGVGFEWKDGKFSFEDLLRFLVRGGNRMCSSIWEQSGSHLDLGKAEFYLIINYELPSEERWEVQGFLEVVATMAAMSNDCYILLQIPKKITAVSESADEGLQNAITARNEPDHVPSVEASGASAAAAASSSAAIPRPIVKNATQILMTAAALGAPKRGWPSKFVQKAGALLNNRQLLYNAVVDYLMTRTVPLSFSGDELRRGVGSNFVECLTSIVWSTDGYVNDILRTASSKTEGHVLIDALRVHVEDCIKTSLLSSNPDSPGAVIVPSKLSTSAEDFFVVNTSWSTTRKQGAPRLLLTKLIALVSELSKNMINLKWLSYKRSDRGTAWAAAIRAYDSLLAGLKVKISKLQKAAEHLKASVKQRQETVGSAVDRRLNDSVQHCLKVVSRFSVKSREYPAWSHALLEAIKSAAPFEVISAVDHLPAEYIVDSHFRYELFNRLMLQDGLPASVLNVSPFAVSDNIIMVISRPERGVHPAAHFFFKMPAAAPSRCSPIGSSDEEEHRRLRDYDSTSGVEINELLELRKKIDVDLYPAAVRKMFLLKYRESLQRCAHVGVAVDNSKTTLLLESVLSQSEETTETLSRLLPVEKLSALKQMVTVLLCDADPPPEDLLVDCQKEFSDPSRFDSYWKAVETVLNVKQDGGVVHGRRLATSCAGMASDQQVQYLPVAMSVANLQREVEILLRGEGTLSSTDIPCEEWLRRQFQPRRKYAAVAASYTGRFPVKFSMQTRTRRAPNIDAHYVASFFVSVKQFAVLWKRYCIMLGEDDKSKVAIGEPGLPVASIDRNRPSLKLLRSETAEAMDHDVGSTHKLTVSVALVHEIPTEAHHSFNQGLAVAIIKNSLFEQSNAHRHATELDLALEAIPDKLLPASKHAPVMLVNTDGGPDRNNTFLKVIMWDMMTFIDRDLDFLCHYRCPANHSYLNKVERVMPALNIVLNGCSFARSTCADSAVEKRLSSCSTQNEIRDLVSEYPDDPLKIPNAVNESLNGVVKTLIDRIRAGQYSGRGIEVAEKASDDELNTSLSRFKELLRLEDVVDFDVKLISWSKSKRLSWMTPDSFIPRFLEIHARMTKYATQFLKCKPGKCPMGVCRPPRMADEDFNKLNFIGMPAPDPENPGHYMKAGMSTILDDRYCPSILERKKPLNKQPRKKSLASHPADKLLVFNGQQLLRLSKARAFILCTNPDCQKPRLIYGTGTSVSKMEERLLIGIIEESDTWVCGDSLIPVGSKLHKAYCGEPVKDVRVRVVAPRSNSKRFRTATTGGGRDDSSDSGDCESTSTKLGPGVKRPFFDITAAVAGNISESAKRVRISPDEGILEDGTWPGPIKDYNFFNKDAQWRRKPSLEAKEHPSGEDANESGEDADESGEDVKDAPSSEDDSSVLKDEDDDSDTECDVFPVTNSRALFVRQSLDCSAPVETSFYAVKHDKSCSRMFLSSFKVKAFGSASEGGLAPLGFCWACGGTENMLEFERLQLLEAYAEVFPMCKNCHEVRNISFCVGIKKKMNKPKTAEKVTGSNLRPLGSYCLAKYRTKEKKVVWYPAVIIRLKSGGFYDVLFFDHEVQLDVAEKETRDMVSKGSLVLAFWRADAWHNAILEDIDFADAPPLDASLIETNGISLPLATVSIRFVDDDVKLDDQPLKNICVPHKLLAKAAAGVTKRRRKGVHAKK